MSTSTPTASGSATAEELLARSRPDRPRRLYGRELRVELALAALVLVGAAVCAVALPSDRPVEPLTIAACVAVFAVFARVCLYVGGGCALATQLVFVPMLFLLPLGLVPGAVVLALVAAALPDVLGPRREPYDRLLTAVGDSGYAFAPMAVLALAGEPAPDAGQWALLAVAFGAQVVLDSGLSVAREWLGRGIRPALQLYVMVTVYAVDALLLPFGLITAHVAAADPLVVLGTLPLGLLLAALARDRNRRLNAALDRVEDVQVERDRVRVAIDRTARSLGYSLDRAAMLEVALGTSVDAVAGAAGRARLTGSFQGLLFEAVPNQPGAGEAEALLAVERAALSGQATELVEQGWSAIGRPLRGAREPTVVGAIAVCRAGGPFSREQAALFTYLAAQTAASIEAIDLHEQLLRRGIEDALTGLVDRRQFQELLRVEVERSGAARPLSLLVIDVDGLRSINAEQGFAAGDEALQVAAAVAREHAGEDAEPARLGGSALAVTLPDRTLDEASALGATIGEDLLLRGLSASIGAAGRSSRVATPEALLGAAEVACGEARREGAGHVVGFRGPYEH